MGTKPTALHYLPALRIFATFQRNEKRTPEALRETLEKVIGDTAQEYPWHTDCYLENKNGGFVFSRFGSKTPVGFCWIIRDIQSYGNSPNDVEFNLSLSCAIKGSQIVSIIRHGEMLGKIISARHSTLASFIVRAHFDSPAYETSHRHAEPGDIIKRQSQPGEYFYFDRVSENGVYCELIALESLGNVPDRITTPHNFCELLPVDHFPQLSADERTNLLTGNDLGDREPLIAKWRRVVRNCGGGRMD